ncbi:MAG: phage holin family protein [Actinomycetota bacterium]
MLRKEVELARHEIVASVIARVKAVGAFAAAAALAFAALLFGAIAGTLALGTVVAAWVAALIVAGCFLAICGIAAMFGVRRMKAPSIAPKETVRTVKEDVEWTRELLKR